MPAKKWRLVYADQASDEFSSRDAAYEYVNALRDQWAGGAPWATGRVTVQEREGHTWTTVDHIDFAEEGVQR